MPRKLKVFRTPTGFHDAYVAAPSRKAALAAWGANVDLFARGAAEEVTDAASMADALAAPGKVIRKIRGTEDEHFAALPPDKPKTKPTTAAPGPAPPEPPPKPKPKPKPRPSRDALDAAEAAVAQEDERYAGQRKDITARIAALERERDAAARDHDDTADRLERARAKAEAEYAAAMREWRG